MRAFGLKHTARRMAEANGVPLLPGTRPAAGMLTPAAAGAQAHRLPRDAEEHRGRRRHRHARVRIAERTAPTHTRPCERSQPAAASATAASTSKNLSRARATSRSQIFGDGHGNVIALGERDCSAQRRNQKVIEETPAPGLDRRRARAPARAAVRLGKAVQYRVRRHGGVHLRRRPCAAAFYFLEVNTRLQVEHGVTEEVTGVDLVEWMVRQAAGEPRRCSPVYRHARRCRHPGAPLCRGPGAKDFRPARGRLTQVRLADTLRAWKPGSNRGTRSHSLSTIRCWPRSSSHAPTRAARSSSCAPRSAECRIAGIETNLEYLRQVMRQRRLRGAAASPPPVPGSFAYRAATPIEVLEPGTQTTVQDYPGRLRLLARRRAALGPDGCAGVAHRQSAAWATPRTAPRSRSTVTGPTLRFGSDARHRPDRRGHARATSTARRSLWRAGAGGKPAGAQARVASRRQRASAAYLAVAGGFDVPRLSGQPQHLHPGKIRRPCRARAAQPATCCASATRPRHGHATARARRSQPTSADVRATNGKSASSTARTARRISSPRPTSNVLLHRLEGALQFRPHRHPPDRPQARNGRGTTAARPAAPLQHPRQRLRRRHHRFHRRHAGDPRPGRPQSRRLRLSGDHRPVLNSGRSASCDPGDLRSVPRHRPRRTRRYEWSAPPVGPP